MKKLLVFLCSVLLFSVTIFSTNVSALLVNFNISGQLNSVSDSGDLLGGYFSVGDTFTGYFSYDTDMPDK